jgi:rubrerythrin
VLHAFARTFALPPEQPSRVSALPPLRASAYLRLRREAAGLSIMDVAGRLARNAGEVAAALDTVHALEAPTSRARYRETLERLRAIFPLDADVYHQLATEPASLHPLVCRRCGSSAWDDENACPACSGDDR